MTEVQAPARPSYAGALLRYRVMAYVTGVVLFTATTMLIVQDVFDVNSIKTPTGIVWVLHGYCYLVYVAVTLHLWLKLGLGRQIFDRRGTGLRLVLTLLAGTIPLLSFVAERSTVRFAHEHAAATNRV
jgi:integral membrane protein